MELNHEKNETIGEPARRRNNSSKTRSKAWELFQRQPRLGVARREEFEREHKQRAQKYSLFCSSSADEKSLQARVEDLLKIDLAED